MVRGKLSTEIITPSGMINRGGGIATTASSLSPAAGITGIRVGGILRGATLRTRIMLTTVRFTRITTYRPIR